MSLAYETEVQVEAGKSYYFSLGTPGTGKMGQDLLNQTYAGGSGQQMRPQSLLSAGFASPFTVLTRSPVQPRSNV
jgi:hypothetical protein